MNSRYALPGNIVSTRNVKVILCFLEMIMDIFCIVFLILRQSSITIVFTIGNLIILGVGLWATLRLNFWGLVTHAVYAMGVIGGFVIYKIIDTIIYMNLDR